MKVDIDMTTTRMFLIAVASVLLLAPSGASASSEYCPALNAEVDSWETHLKSYGDPRLVSVAGVLAYGDTVTNGNTRVLHAKHKTDVSTIFVRNPSNDFIRVVTSVPVGVEGSHQPAVGTTLPYGGPAWVALTAGTSYCGTVNLFGTNYDSVYRPIFSGGHVVGALFVGQVTARRK